MKRTAAVLILVLGLLCLPPSALAAENDDSSGNETDLEIKTETITRRGYSGTAVTDKYEIEILTAESYEQANEIAARQEQTYLAAQASLFVTGSGAKKEDSVASTVARLGLFDSSYTLKDTQSLEQTTEYSVWLTVCLLALGVGAGIALAIVLQKRKGGQTE